MIEMASSNMQSHESKKDFFQEKLMIMCIYIYISTRLLVVASGPALSVAGHRSGD